MHNPSDKDALATHPDSAVFDQLVRTRRTHKAFEPEPVSTEVLDELFDLARWAPNHNLTNPWRFRVIGPRTLESLCQAAGRKAAAKLIRAPTLVLVSVIQSGSDSILDEENFAAAACATLIILLAAHARGLVGYWRTPEVIRTIAGRAACNIPDNEKVIGLLYLGYGKDPNKQAPIRDEVDSIRSYLP
jgi:nitroreductase